MAKIGVEASEIMGAVAMFMTSKQIEDYSKDAIGLMTFLKEGKKIAKSDKIVYPSGTKDKFLKAFGDPHDKDFLLAAVAGMSASIATRKWVPTRSAQTSRDAVINSDKIPEKVFLTGDSWPKEVQQFLVARDGFDSYNSSDYIIKWANPRGLSYYGISLKKKKKPKAGDPTLINKAFDTVLQSSNPKELKRLNEIKKEIDEAKVKYFARVVKEAATTNPPGSKTPYLTFTNGQVLPNSPEDVMKIRVNMPGFAKKALPLIDIKGIGKIDLQKSKMKNNKTVDENLVALIAKIGEKITIGRSKTLNVENSRNFVYQHSVIKDNVSKLVVIVSLNTIEKSDEINLFGKQLSMHIAASNPIALDAEDIDQELIDKEVNLIAEELKNSGKPDEIAKKISLGKINKFKEENSLMTQDWVMDPKMKVKNVISSLDISNLNINEFVRIKIGE